MADYNFSGKELSDVLGSYNSYKGKRTTAARKLELLLDLQSKNFSAITTTNITAELKNCERIVEILAAIAGVVAKTHHCKTAPPKNAPLNFCTYWKTHQCKNAPPKNAPLNFRTYCKTHPPDFAPTNIVTLN